MKLYCHLNFKVCFGDFLSCLHKSRLREDSETKQESKESNKIGIILLTLFFFNLNAIAEGIDNNIQKVDGHFSSLNVKADLVFEPVPPEKLGTQLKAQNSNKNSALGNEPKKQTQVSISKPVSGKKYLVEKLNYLNQTLPKNHKARKALNLRLAHILSLIAEENFIKHEKEKCLECLKTAQDSALRSLVVYQMLDSVLSEHPFLHTTALFKQAYLERFLGNKTKSLFHLKKITEKKNIPAGLIARAYYNMGEIYFELYDYGHSLAVFNQVLKIKSPWEFKAAYRKIWSLFNLSRYQQSIEELMVFLKSRMYAQAQRENQLLKQKLEGELVTLYSYSEITNQTVDFLYNFNKQSQKENTVVARNQRLFDLAKALSRIGRLKDSNKVWTFYLSKTNRADEQLLAYSFILGNDLILNYPDKLDKVGKKIERIFVLQKKTDKHKKEVNKKIQKFFSQVSKEPQLNSRRKKEYLLSLYQRYNSIDPGNARIFLAGGELAKNLRQYILAGELFRTAYFRFKKTEEGEKIAVQQMEVAELTQKDDIRLKAYQFYIDHGSSSPLIFKAKYQIAYMAYSNKEFKKASERFKRLALSETEKSVQALQLRSAHLCLSALNQIGNQEEKLALQAGLFMKRFPKNRKEFVGIYNSAVLNTVKKLVFDKDFSHRPIQADTDKNILRAWEFLQLFSVKDADKKSLSSYYLDKLLLAKELLKFQQMDQSLKVLLADKDLSSEDRELALTWQLWLAELRFDFKEVLKIVKILNPSDQSEEHLLRLARLSELAGENPIPYYKTFIKKFPNSQFSLAVLTSLVEKSSSDKEKKEFLKKYSDLYKKDSRRLTDLILKVDRGQLDSSFLGFFTKLSFMKDTFLYSFEQRRQAIEAFEKALQKTSLYSLSSKISGARLNFKLKKWTQAVNELQQTASALLKTQDWTARIFIMSHLKKELERFYSSVMNLPAPKALTGEERKEYKILLANQLQVYDEPIKQLDKELKSLWLRDFLSDYQTGLKQDSIFYPPLKWELKKLAESAEGKQKEQIQILLSSLTHQLEGRQVKAKNMQIEPGMVNSLYKVLQKNPFDRKSLNELLSLEQKRENEALSFYLANRIEELEQKRKGDRL